LALMLSSSMEVFLMMLRLAISGLGLLQGWLFAFLFPTARISLLIIIFICWPQEAHKGAAERL